MDKIAELLAEAHVAFLRWLTKQGTKVIAVFDRSRLRIIELLTKYADNDGIVKRGRLLSLIREVEVLAKSTRVTGLTAIVDVTGKAVQSALDIAEGVFKKAASFTRKSAVLSGIKGGTSPVNIADYLAKRTGPDGLTLTNRVWTFASEQEDAIKRLLRGGITRGDTITKMIRDIKAVYDGDEWKIRRLVVTESNSAYRRALGYAAEQSSQVAALRLHRGIADRPEHRCSQLEKIDKHGLGAGIFLPSDNEIYSPHPNCTSFLTFVLK